MLPSSLPSRHDRLSRISSESGLEFISSFGTKEPSSGLGIEGLDPILKRYSLVPGDIIDFFGGSCCGKTTLLYAICIATTLPHQWILRSSSDSNGNIGCQDDDVILELGGKHKGVVFLDLDLGFDVSRLRQLFHNHIQNALAVKLSASSTEMDPTRKHAILQGWKNRVYQPCVDKLIDSCLDNIHVFTPSSASNTIATVKTLDQFLLKLAATLSSVPSESVAAETTVSRVEPGPSDPRASDQTLRETYSRRMYQPISILMIDSLSAFYWQERPQNNYSSFIVQLERALQHLRTRWGLIVLYTTWSLHPSPEILYPESWRSKVKFRFTIASKLLDRIPAHVDLVSLWRKQFEDWTEQAQRAQMVAKEPWQIPFMANGSETQHPPKNHPNARQESSSSEIDFEWDDVDDSNIGPKNQAKHLDDLDTARASYFQVQMAHPQPAHGRPWEIFRFSVSDVSGVQFFHIPC